MRAPNASRATARTRSSGKHFSCFYPPKPFSAGLPEQELQTAAKEGRFEDEGWRVRKDGKQFWANVIITALRDKDGTLRGFAKVTRDLTERKQAEERIQQQSKEIMELSTPVMQVWQGVVVAPLIGSLDSQRTQQFMERLLNRIVETNSPVALVDIMGVPTIDTQTAQHLIETISAVRLLGAQVVLTGVRPAIAQTLVHLGIDLSDILTRSSLAAGLRVALDMLNLQVVAKNGKPLRKGRYGRRKHLRHQTPQPAAGHGAARPGRRRPYRRFRSKCWRPWRGTSARGLVLDISTVETLDSFFARTIAETVQMVALMGGRTVLAGMRASVAVTATQLRLDDGQGADGPGRGPGVRSARARRQPGDAVL